MGKLIDEDENEEGKPVSPDAPLTYVKVYKCTMDKSLLAS